MVGCRQYSNISIVTFSTLSRISVKLCNIEKNYLADPLSVIPFPLTPNTSLPYSSVPYPFPPIHPPKGMKGIRVRKGVQGCGEDRRIHRGQGSGIGEWGKGYAWVYPDARVPAGVLRVW